MTTIITVTEFPSMPGRYRCDHQKIGGRTYSNGHAGRDPEAAAATAVNIAINTAGPYVIMGPKQVLACIPEEIRSRK